MPTYRVNIEHTVVRSYNYEIEADSLEVAQKIAENSPDIESENFSDESDCGLNVYVEELEENKEEEE